MVSLAQITLRTVQFIFNLLVMALVGNAIATIFTGTPASINYAMFVAAFNWIVILYGLAAAFFDGLAIPVVMYILDGLAMVFSMVGGIVLAAKLHVHSCGNFDYLLSNNLTRNSDSPKKTCRELQASTAFLWFLFAAFAGSLVVTFISSKGSFSTGRSGMRRGPAMSQV